MLLVNSQIHKILLPELDCCSSASASSSLAASLSSLRSRVCIPKNKVTYARSGFSLPELFCGSIVLFVWQKPLSELRNVCHDLWFLNFPPCRNKNPVADPSSEDNSSHHLRYLFAALRFAPVKWYVNNWHWGHSSPTLPVVYCSQIDVNGNNS